MQEILNTPLARRGSPLCRGTPSFMTAAAQICAACHIPSGCVADRAHEGSTVSPAAPRTPWWVMREDQSDFRAVHRHEFCLTAKDRDVHAATDSNQA